MNMIVDSRLAERRPARLVSMRLAFVAALFSLAALACSSSGATTAAAPASVAEDGAPTPASPPDAASDDGGMPESSPPAEGDGRLSSILLELNPAGPKEVSAFSFMQLLPKDAILPIYDPTIATPDGAEELDSRELVIGVEIAGEARAYPIRPLRFREMVNDELGGVPIVVTW